MKSKDENFFWASYTDLMTSLFFIMLVLYVLTYVRLNSTIKLQKDKLAIIEAVEENMKPLKKDTSLFSYEEEYKRFKLAFEVKFKTNRFQIDNNDLENYYQTLSNIDKAGIKLKATIDNLLLAKSNPRLKNVSYILVIAGYASKDKTGEYHNYELSYKRAWELWQHWKNDMQIDFEDPKYNGLIDLQISGNGWGGIGRLPHEVEENNQRFLIQIFPKIGDIK